MEILGQVIELLKWISAPISRCWEYHSGLQENVETLNQSMEELDCRRRDINARLGNEIVEGETESKAEVQQWLRRVEKIRAEIETIKRDVETVKYFSRAGMGKNVVQKIEEVEELYRNGVFTDGLILQLPRQLPRQTGEMQPTTTLGGEATFTRKMEEVWALLTGDEVRKIGVYGMGGVGKTTLLKHTNNRLLEEEEKFEWVIWVTASKASSIIKLQDAVVREIEYLCRKKNIDFICCRLILESDDETVRARMLYAELSKIKSYVLIIDDLWDAYRLDEVGIPEPSPQNGSKLVLTTRLRDVCQKMSCKAIPMERLSETESLKLFLDTVGREVLTNPEMEEIVNSVVKECACLPLAIVTIAASFKGIVDCNNWKTALEDLKASAKGTDEVFEKLKFSYDRLNDENLQACLLYCALFPEDYAIERNKLIEYLIAEEIVQGRNRQAEFERGQAMLNKLVYACLLEDTIGQHAVDCVKMHDLIRDMALQITSERAPTLVEAGMGLKRVPDEENWKEDLAKVSLMENAISDIPLSFESPRCPTLSTLLLNSNRSLRSISDNFFRHMTGLGLVDLSETCIENLPESISELVNLTALWLRGCDQLMYVPSLAKLTALKRLDFYQSGIKEVPQGMENLVSLRYLDFGWCNQLEIIPDGVICKLLNLRYLSLNEVRGATTRGEELVYLRKLERIYCVLHDLNGFNAYVRSLAEGGPAYYLLQLGFTGGVSWRAVHKHGKVVYLINCDISESVAKGGDCPLLLPQDVEILAIYNCCINVSSLCELTSFENATNFKWCYIKKCGELKHLFVYSSSIIRLLQGLEDLDLEAVWDLQGLIRRENLASSAPLPPGTFCSLKKLRVCNCGNIKRLSIVAPLPNLEKIIVFECKQLVEIVATTSDNDEEEEDQEHVEATGGRSHQAISVVILPKLLDLDLNALPKLKSIPVIADNSLRVVRIWECPKLKKVPCLDRVPVPVSLRGVSIGEDMWESLEWDHPSAKDAIQSRWPNRR